MNNTRIMAGREQIEFDTASGCSLKECPEFYLGIADDTWIRGISSSVFVAKVLNDCLSVFVGEINYVVLYSELTGCLLCMRNVFILIGTVASTSRSITLDCAVPYLHGHTYDGEPSFL